MGRDSILVRLNVMLNKREVAKAGKRSQSILSVDNQLVKLGSLTNLEKCIIGNKKINGKKRHVITNTVGGDPESCG